MTVAEMAKRIGQQASWYSEGLEVIVQVKDVKQAYGNVLYQITPISGAGLKWVRDLSWNEDCNLTVDSRPSLT